MLPPPDAATAAALARLYDLDLQDDPGDLDLYLALADRADGPILELAAGPRILAAFPVWLLGAVAFRMGSNWVPSRRLATVLFVVSSGAVEMPLLRYQLVDFHASRTSSPSRQDGVLLLSAAPGG